MSVGHCPSADDPYTAVDETKCFNVTAPNSNFVGGIRNKCHVDCANRGICDYKTGQCQCFDGMYGSACNIIDADRVYVHWSKGRTPSPVFEKHWQKQPNGL